MKNSKTASFKNNLMRILTAAIAAILCAVHVSALSYDINDDGRVNSVDLTRMMKYISDSSSEFAVSYDINSDGRINALDLTRLMKVIASGGEEKKNPEFSLSLVPPYSGQPYAVINENKPYFTEDEITEVSFECYGELDSLGRCGSACASVGSDIMPTEERGSIGSVTPSGWYTVKYDFIDGNYLYNRCHLIGYQLTGENANERNLITGTRYMNVSGMLPFENMVADYVKETGENVMYRSTPLFEGDNLVAEGVLIEALSVRDDGDSVRFCVFCYNVQPSVIINYKDGTSSAAAVSDTEPPSAITYILNESTRKFHTPGCSAANKIADKNRGETDRTRDELIADGFSPCGICKP